MAKDIPRTPTPKYMCTYGECTMSFSRPYRLEIHVRTHTGERPYICDFDDCGKSYVRKMHLDRHFDTAHKKKSSVCDYACTVNRCSKTFASKCGLDKHITSSHYDPDKYRCPENGCDKTFHKKHQLRAHNFEHAGVLPFQCDAPGCNKQFKQTSHLARHKKMHNLYTCDVEDCPEKFEKWSLLRRHKSQQHLTMHMCKICKKSFRRPVLLHKHAKVHIDDNVTMYKCPHSDCSRFYSEVKNLKAHVRSYHEGIKLKCDECGQEVVNKSKLLHHMKRHHQQDISPSNKSYPKKGHRRKAASVKVVDHILSILAPVDDADLSGSGIDKTVKNKCGSNIDITDENKCGLDIHNTEENKCDSDIDNTEENKCVSDVDKTEIGNAENTQLSTVENFLRQIRRESPACDMDCTNDSVSNDMDQIEANSCMLARTNGNQSNLIAMESEGRGECSGTQKDPSSVGYDNHTRVVTQEDNLLEIDPSEIGYDVEIRTIFH